MARPSVCLPDRSRVSCVPRPYFIFFFSFHRACVSWAASFLPPISTFSFFRHTPLVVPNTSARYPHQVPPYLLPLQSAARHRACPRSALKTSGAPASFSGRLSSCSRGLRPRRRFIAVFNPHPSGFHLVLCRIDTGVFVYRRDLFPVDFFDCPCRDPFSPMI